MLVVAGHWELHMHIPEFGSQTVIPDNGFLYAAFKDSSGEFSCLVWGRTSLQHIWKALKKLLSVSLHQHFWAYWFPKGYRECSTGSLPAITLCSSTEKLVWAHFGQVAGLLHNLFSGISCGLQYGCTYVFINPDTVLSGHRECQWHREWNSKKLIALPKDCCLFFIEVLFRKRDGGREEKSFRRYLSGEFILWLKPITFPLLWDIWALSWLLCVQSLDSSFCNEFSTCADICNCCILVALWMERVIFLGQKLKLSFFHLLHQSTQCIKKCEISHPDILQAA